MSNNVDDTQPDILTNSQQFNMDSAVYVEDNNFLNNSGSIQVNSIVSSSIAPVYQSLEENLIRPKPLPPLDSFAGREEELAELKYKLKIPNHTGIFSIQGLGGMGKTVLARQAAWDLYNEGVFQAVLWLDIGVQDNALDLLNNLIRQVQPNYESIEQESVEHLGERLRILLRKIVEKEPTESNSKRILLVLNNVEKSHIEDVKNLKNICPKNTNILLTSRLQQVAISLSSASDTINLTSLSTSDSMKLLENYINKEIDKNLLFSLSQVLNGNPLALRLAAQRFLLTGGKESVLAQQIQEYNQTLSLLVTQDPNINIVEESLVKVISYSYNNFSIELKTNFRAMGAVLAYYPFDFHLLKELWGYQIDLKVKKTIDDFTQYFFLEVITNNEIKLFRIHSALQTYANFLLSQNPNEEIILKKRYQNIIIKLTGKFHTLLPEEWDQASIYLPHIYALGTKLVEETNSVQVDEWVWRNAIEFAYNTSHYLTSLKGLQGKEWLTMGLLASRQLQYKDKEIHFLNKLGLLYVESDERNRGLEFFQEALFLSEEEGDRTGKALVFNNLGKVYADIGEYTVALDYYKQALSLQKAVNDLRAEANTLNSIGKIYAANMGSINAALDCYEQALSLHRTVSNKNGEANTLNNIGSVYRFMGNYNKALIFCETALTILRAIGDRDGEATTLNNLGSIYFYLGETEYALRHYEQALSVIQAVKNRGEEASILSNIGFVCSNFGEVEQALDYYQRALRLYEQLGNIRGNSITLLNIGSIYVQLGKLERALEYYKQALVLHRQIGDIDREAITLNGIGFIYSSLGNLDYALEYYEQALVLHQQIGNSAEQAITLNDIADVYRQSGEETKALECYKYALKYYSEIGDLANQADVTKSIGEIYIKLGNTNLAMECYHQALLIVDKLDDKNGQAAMLTNIGSLYFLLGEEQKAELYYKRALSLQKVIGNHSSEATILSNLGQIYFRLGRTEDALTYFQQALSIQKQMGDNNGVYDSQLNIKKISDINQKQLKIFLSHDNQKHPLFINLYNRLREEGWLTIWYNADDLLPGQNWELEIRKKILNADVVLVCLSSSSPKVHYQQREIRLSLEKMEERAENDVTLIPILLQEEVSLPLSLRGIHAVKLYENSGYSNLIKALRAKAETLDITMHTRKSSKDKSLSRFANNVLKSLGLHEQRELNLPGTRTDYLYEVELPKLGLKLNSHKAILFIRQKNESLIIYDQLRDLANKRGARFVLIVDWKDIQTEPPHLGVNELLWITNHHLDELTSLSTREEQTAWLGRFITREIDISQMVPYRASGIATELFYGRVQEFNQLLDGQLARGGILLGAHQSGKSSILSKLSNYLDDNPRYCIVGPLTLSGKNYNYFFSETLERLGLNVQENNQLSPTQWGLYIADFEKKTGRQPVFMLDEVDTLVGYDGQNEYKLGHEFRALQYNNIARFYLAGHSTLRHATETELCPYRNLAPEIILTGLDTYSAVRLITEPIKQIGFEINNIQAQQIIQGTAGVAVLIQFFCLELLKLLHTKKYNDPYVADALLDDISNSELFLRFVYKHFNYNNDAVGECLLQLLAIQDGLDISEITTEFCKANLFVSWDELDARLNLLTGFNVVHRVNGKYNIVPTYLKKYLSGRDAEKRLQAKFEQARRGGF